MDHRVSPPLAEQRPRFNIHNRRVADPPSHGARIVEEGAPANSLGANQTAGKERVDSVVQQEGELAPKSHAQDASCDIGEAALCGLYPEDQVAEVLLEHARWIGSDLAQRIDTMTQRAGILLSASLTLVTLWFAILLVVAEGHPVNLMVGSAAALLTYSVPTACSLCALITRTYHSVGAESITRYLATDNRPSANDWPDIHNQLVNDLLSASDKGNASVLHGMERDINLKAHHLKTAQITLVVATIITPITAVVTYIIRSAT